MDEAVKFTSHTRVKSQCFLCEKNPHSLVMCGVFYINLFWSAPLLEVFQLPLLLPYYLQLYFSPGCEWCRHMQTKTWRTTWVLLPYSDHNVCVCACARAHTHTHTRVHACISMLETFVNMNLMVQKRQSCPRNLKKTKTKKFQMTTTVNQSTIARHGLIFCRSIRKKIVI